MYKDYFKPFFDYLVSLLGILILSPIFIVVLIALLISNKGNVFFLQKRPGKNEKIFKIIKFRTMNDKKNLNGDLLPDSERLTLLGKVIRKTSLDEIPQLINVLKGDMSLIGPRPLLPEYLSLYNEIQKKRHEVKPGITGWWQVSGRSTIGYPERCHLELYYVEKSCFTFDVLILLKTIGIVLKRVGAR